MKRLIVRSLTFAALSAGAVLIGGAPAQADMISVGNSGILSGNQVSNVVQVPISICGNAIAVLGNATAGCVGGAVAANDVNYYYGGGMGANAAANRHHHRMSNARANARTWSRYHHHR
jgi:hypothetical protein